MTLVSIVYIGVDIKYSSIYYEGDENQSSLNLAPFKSIQSQNGRGVMYYQLGTY